MAMLFKNWGRLAMVAAFCVVTSNAAFAQEGPVTIHNSEAAQAELRAKALQPMDMDSANEEFQPRELPPIDFIEIKKDIPDEYADPSLQNLSKLMWHLGVLDLSDNVAIDQYLLINECDLYQRFYTNDIEWDKIRNATRESIKKNTPNFATTFEIMLPIYISRYNPERGYFELATESKMSNLRRLDVNLNSLGRICNMGVHLRGYTRNLRLHLNRPFTLTRIAVSRQLAELYLEEARINYERIPQHLRQNHYRRIAFLRAKVRINNFEEFIMPRPGQSVAVVHGQLEGIEVYADRERQKLLFRQDAEERSLRQRQIERRLGKSETQDLGGVEGR